MPHLPTVNSSRSPHLQEYSVVYIDVLFIENAVIIFLLEVNAAPPFLFLYEPCFTPCKSARSLCGATDPCVVHRQAARAAAGGRRMSDVRPFFLF